MRRDNMYVTSDGALKIEEPVTVENSGHFACTALNVVGAAIARSHLVVFEPAKAGNSNSSNASKYEQENGGLEKARLSLLEKSIKEVNVQPLSSSSLRVTWKLLR